MSPRGLNYRSAVWKYKNPNLCINLTLFHVCHSSVEFSANGSTCFRLFYSKDDGASRRTVQDQSLKHLSGIRGEDTDRINISFQFCTVALLFIGFSANRRHDILSFSTLSDFTLQNAIIVFSPRQILNISSFYFVFGTHARHLQAITLFLIIYFQEIVNIHISMISHLTSVGWSFTFGFVEINSQLLMGGLLYCPDLS